MMDILENLALQRHIAFYMEDLAPTLTYGRYYLQYILRDYVVTGPGPTPSELLRRTAAHYDRTPRNIRYYIDSFLRDVNNEPRTGIVFEHWKEIGWDGETPMKLSFAIPLICNGFVPYLKRHYPLEYRELLELPSISPDVIVASRPATAGTDTCHEEIRREVVTEITERMLADLTLTNEKIAEYVGMPIGEIEALKRKRERI